MLSHRIDFAQHLVGPMQRLVAQHENPRSRSPGRPERPRRLGRRSSPSFQGGATGVLESSKLASGRNEGWRSLDYVELNGSEATFEFTTGKWNELQYGKLGGPGLAPLQRAARILGLARQPARSGRRRSAGHLPLRPGVRVHRRHPPPAPLHAELSRWRPCASGDGFRRALGGDAGVGGCPATSSSGKRMSDKTAVITGAGSGVGAAIARALARDGWRVALVGRRASRSSASRRRFPAPSSAFAMWVWRARSRRWASKSSRNWARWKRS